MRRNIFYYKINLRYFKQTVASRCRLFIIVLHNMLFIQNKNMNFVYCYENKDVEQMGLSVFYHLLKPSTRTYVRNGGLGFETGPGIKTWVCLTGMRVQDHGHQGASRSRSLKFTVVRK